MRRVVITGIGIVSSIGNNAAEVEASLRAGKSGIVFSPEYAEHGFRSQVHGMPQIDLAAHIGPGNQRGMQEGTATDPAVRVRHLRAQQQRRRIDGAASDHKVLCGHPHPC